YHFSSAKASPSKKVPFILVGAGPSFDQDVRYLKKLQHNAIIMSCGTAILPLLKAGIRPDFHIEIENVPAAYLSLKLTHEKFDLSKTVLVVTSTFNPGATDFFNHIVYYVRPSLSASAFVERKHQVTNAGSNPATVGLMFANLCGFREIYLFGVDFGSRFGKHHHAKDSFYYSDIKTFTKGIPSDLKQLYPEKVRANFGGYCQTNIIFKVGLVFLNQCANEANQSTIYNCSNGVYIEHTIPKLAQTIKLEGLQLNKKQYVDAMLKHEMKSIEPLLDRFDFADVGMNIKNSFDALVKPLIKKIDLLGRQDFESQYIKKQLSNQLYSLNVENVDDQYVACAKRIARGTVWSCAIYYWIYANRLKGDPLKYFSRLFIREYQLVLTYMLQQTHQFFATLKKDGVCDK
ncbi:MAG: 6-hydroxymethylpterin diphosphokinase MptE-like protein, partial [Pseudomonadota bacterium]